MRPQRAAFLTRQAMCKANLPRGHHTDRGSQYCSHDYQKIRRQHGFKVSLSHACKHALPGPWMSGKGNCYDNAAPSRQICFANTLPGNGRDVLQNPFSGHCYAIPCQAGIKAELIWRRSSETRRQAEMEIFEYINGFYNPRPSRDIRLANALPRSGRHSALGWKSPVAFERKVA